MSNRSYEVSVPMLRGGVDVEVVSVRSTAHTSFDLVVGGVLVPRLADVPIGGDRMDRRIAETRVRVTSAARCVWSDVRGRVECSMLTPSASDLGVAIAVLGASGALHTDRRHDLPREILANHVFIGELALDGRIRPVRGLLAMLLAARDAGHLQAVVPQSQLAEARAVHGTGAEGAAHPFRVVGAETLSEVVAYLRCEGSLPSAIDVPRVQPVPRETLSLGDVRGQDDAVLAFREAVTSGVGRILLVGPPGSGKTMLARRAIGLLPPLVGQALLDVRTLASVAGLDATIAERPFRAPHHTASMPGLVGGGDPVRPGEVSLAHEGVLFLDEIGEFRRDAFHALIAALNQGESLVVSRRAVYSMPARPRLVIATMDPCPCGFHGDREALGDEGRPCTCSPERLERYRARMAPVLEAFPTQIMLKRVRTSDLRRTSTPTPAK